MRYQPVSRDIRGRLVFLGTGTSHGIPVIGCGCEVCRSPTPRNHRSRCSVALGLPEGNLLIDTPPELRVQLVREGIGVVHSVLFTHTHADHLFGLDDCRIFGEYLGHDLPICCTEHAEQRIRTAYDYAFDPVVQNGPGGGVPRLAFRRIAHEPFRVLGMPIVPVPMRHGRAEVLGFRFGDVAYCTDTNDIPPSSMRLLEGLDVLILDCLRRQRHSTHFTLEQALEVSRQLQPRRTLFTHMCHDLEHEATNAELPAGVELAYDGLSVPLGLEVE